MKYAETFIGLIRKNIFLLHKQLRSGKTRILEVLFNDLSPILRDWRPRSETTTIARSAVAACVEEIVLSASFALLRMISLFQLRSEEGFIVDKAFHKLKVDADYSFFTLCPLVFSSDLLPDNFR